MCGICGVLTPNAGEVELESLLRRMVAAISHRGPDEAGIFLGRGVGLGHARLSIIDPAGGHQPLSLADGRSWISFNGELFNYRELRTELIEKGRRFLTKSDTEVVLHCWDEWGVDAFARMNGQWAFAVWDAVERQLVLARDPRGIRPLFYARPGRAFMFASEIKSLFASGLLPRRLDPDGLRQSYVLWAPHAPVTAFEGVSQLEPGTLLRVRPGQAPATPERYCETAHGVRSAPEPSRTRQERDARLVELLDEAARLRFERSDVPVGVLISGGLDSSITATLVREHASKGLHAFSIGFADGALNESSHQERFAAHLGVEHHHLDVSDAQIASAFPEAVRHAEQPLLRTAPVPMLLLAREIAAAGYKVVVTGEGADELFGGYDIFREVVLRRRLAAGMSDDELMASAAELYAWRGRSPWGSAGVVRAMLVPESVSHPLASHLRRWKGGMAFAPFFALEHQRHELGSIAGNVEPTLPAGFAGWDDMDRATWLEMSYLLPDYLLSAQGDRMLMASGVEGRFPFLDPDVIAFAMALPEEDKISGMLEKAILRRAFSGRIPQWVLARRKQPYRAPGAKVLSESSWIDDLLCESSVVRAGVFRAEPVQALLRKVREAAEISTADDQRLVGIASTMLLQRDLVDSSPQVNEIPVTVMRRTGSYAAQ